MIPPKQRSFTILVNFSVIKAGVSQVQKIFAEESQKYSPPSLESEMLLLRARLHESDMDGPLHEP